MKLKFSHVLRVTALLVVLASISLVVGCGKGKNTSSSASESLPMVTSPVSGKITYNGKPLPTGFVILFSPMGDYDVTPVNADGEYRAKSVPLGHVNVAVVMSLEAKEQATANLLGIQARMHRDSDPMMDSSAMMAAAMEARGKGRSGMGGYGQHSRPGGGQAGGPPDFGQQGGHGGGRAPGPPTGFDAGMPPDMALNLTDDQIREKLMKAARDQGQDPDPNMIEQQLQNMRNQMKAMQGNQLKIKLFKDLSPEEQETMKAIEKKYGNVFRPEIKNLKNKGQKEFDVIDLTIEEP